ncbi:uncharacterized protein LOC107462284 [Arachis duranensis]|uniref:Uncharacterized protein LOC107462284 n=1 Tax=Arachis duranensis TaxID=130453 RepID=A0A9C6WGW3_ARADU|nr:uncharacterized protein LOC107462284 [Arachis duranensis]
MVKEELMELSDVHFLKRMKDLSLLRRWHKQHFGDITERIKRFEKEIKKVDDMVSSGRYDGTMEARRRALVRCCEKWYVRQDVHWNQMFRSRHANEIDRNTRCYHNIASMIRRNNRIESLEDSPRVTFRDGLVNWLERGEAEALEVLPLVEEVKEVVWNCESSKTPGSDGYNMNFIKKCWNEFGTEFTAAVMSFLETAKLLKDSNITWVALAPKFVGANEIKDLIPISMVGCVYKVISKLLTRRMRSVMPGLVGESQSAFVKGRKIHDGALIACETVQWLKVKKKASVIIKLDFQKAYDRVKWNFIDTVIIGEAVRNSRISLLLVGRNNIELSHLQFANDTILFCPLEKETIMNYKRLLRCFEMMSGLSINFEKSNLIPVNYNQEWVERMCQLLGYQEAAFPVRCDVPGSRSLDRSGLHPLYGTFGYDGMMSFFITRQQGL